MIARTAWLGLGSLCVVLGVIGAVVPLMPTTVFLIAAAACFARSSPRLERWLLGHRLLGPPIVAWRDSGAIPARAKALAGVGMAAGFAIFLAAAHPGPILAVGVGVAMALCATFVLTRPSS